MKNLKFLKNSLIAHRGVHDTVPENSLKSFKLAIEKKHIIEFDVHLLKDDTIVVFHDDNLRRMTGVKKNLRDCTYDDIKKLKLLDTNYYIPTLEEVLNLINGRVPIIIELKYDRKVGLLERELVKVLDFYNGVFCVKSFNPFSVFWFRKNRPDYIRGLLITYKKKNFKEKFLYNKLIYLLCKPDFISCNYRLYNNKRILRYMKKIPVIAWTIKNEKNYLKYKDKFYGLIVDIYK